MLLAVESSLSTFKKLEFGPGLNILQADRTQQSTDGHTRNSAGKTSLVEIIHFVLGSDLRSDNLLAKKVFKGEVFTLTLKISGHTIRVSRGVDDSDRVRISQTDAEALGLMLFHDHKGSGSSYASMSDWKDLLGNRWFGLPAKREGSEFAERYSPSFRSIFSYFVRRTISKAFSSPHKQAEMQQPWDWQTNLSYLIGLDWKLTRARQELRVRLEKLKKLRGAIKEGELGKLFGTAAEIRPEIVRIDEKIDKLRKKVEAFAVHEQYTELANRVAAIRNSMTQITREISNQEETIGYLSNSMKTETSPAYADVQALYAAANVELPGVALRRFEEADRFRESVARNRRMYLQSQVDESTEIRDELKLNLVSLDEEKSGILKVLAGKGAFEDLIRLQEELASERIRRDGLETKLQNANALENDSAGQKRDEAELFVKLQDSVLTHEEKIRDAVAGVDHAIRALYDDRDGNLIIEAVKSGISFSIQIDGGGNQGGIDMMKIFCFDMMLFEIVSARFGGPGFWIHDSHLFDGVDARQVHAAMIYGKKISEGIGSQYIVTMNSDILQAACEFGDEGIRDAILPTSLDDTDTGGLFGFRFI